MSNAPSTKLRSTTKNVEAQLLLPFADDLNANNEYVVRMWDSAPRVPLLVSQRIVFYRTLPGDYAETC